MAQFKIFMSVREVEEALESADKASAQACLGWVQDMFSGYSLENASIRVYRNMEGAQVSVDVRRHKNERSTRIKVLMSESQVEEACAATKDAACLGWLKRNFSRLTFEAASVSFDREGAVVAGKCRPISENIGAELAQENPDDPPPPPPPPPPVIKVTDFGGLNKFLGEYRRWYERVTDLEGPRDDHSDRRGGARGGDAGDTVLDGRGDGPSER